MRNHQFRIDPDGTRTVTYCPFHAGVGWAYEAYGTCPTCTPGDQSDLMVRHIHGEARPKLHGVEHELLDGEFMVPSGKCLVCDLEGYHRIEEQPVPGLYEVRFWWDDGLVARHDDFRPIRDAADG